MKRTIPLSTQLYQALFPFRAEGTDPSTFSEHVRKNLLPEIRHEVRHFYGEELSSTLEARFPGLDYTSRIHRLRLARFPHHHKLFLAFDKLGWTPQEIYNFCDWEGTILVKKRYEKQHGNIRDTSVDYIYLGTQSRGYLTQLPTIHTQNEVEPQMSLPRYGNIQENEEAGREQTLAQTEEDIQRLLEIENEALSNLEPSLLEEPQISNEEIRSYLRRVRSSQQRAQVLSRSSRAESARAAA